MIYGLVMRSKCRAESTALNVQFKFTAEKWEIVGPDSALPLVCGRVRPSECAYASDGHDAAANGDYSK